MNIRLSFALVGVAAAVLIACDGDPKATNPDKPCTNDATAEAVREANSAFGTTDPNGTRIPLQFIDSEIHCRLRPALLKLEDLPGEWGADSLFGGISDHITEDEPSAACGLSYPSFRDGLRSSFKSEGESGGEVRRFVIHEVIALDPGDAARVMAALRHSCGTRANPSPVLTLIEEPDLGDEAVVVDETLGNGDDLVVRTTFIRRGDVISRSSVSPHDALGQPFAARLAERLEDLSALPPPEAIEGEGCPLPDERPENDARLARALLAQTEVPRGWVEDPPEPCGLLGITSTCADRPPGLEPAARAVTAFSGFRGRVTHDVERFEAGVAAKAWDRINQGLAEGRECLITIDDDSIRVVYERADNPFGDGTFTYTVRFEEPAPVERESLAFVVVLHEGDAISWIVLSGDATFLGADFFIKRIEPFLAAAREKLQQLSN